MGISCQLARHSSRLGVASGGARVSDGGRRVCLPQIIRVAAPVRLGDLSAIALATEEALPALPERYARASRRSMGEGVDSSGGHPDRAASLRLRSASGVAPQIFTASERIERKVKHPAASRGASLRNPAKPGMPFLPVASHRASWRRRVKRQMKMPHSSSVVSDLCVLCVLLRLILLIAYPGCLGLRH
jgi:hypothetical protein